MNIKGLFRDPSFTGPVVVIGVITVMFLVMNIFVIGGEEFYDKANTIIAPAAALAAGYLFFQAASNKKDTASRSLWSLMAWGFVLWGVGDTVWAWYSFVLQEEIPTPSIGDLFWISAYAPLYLAILMRIRSLRIKPTRRQLWLILGVNSIWVILTVVYVLLPILRDFDPERLWEGVVSLFYPLADAGLVIMLSIILILLREGRFSLVWRLIFGGIFCMAASDLLYYYASWQGTYLPDGHVNAVSVLSDTTYSLAYIMAVLGMFIYRFIWNVEKSFQLSVDHLPGDRYYTFVGTNRENELISISNNFFCLVQGEADFVYYRRRLNEVLGISAGAWQVISQQIINKEMICNEPITIAQPNQKSQKIWITAVATFNPGQEFTGANYLLSADIPVPDDLRMPKSGELLRLANHLLAQAGSRPQDEIQAMQVYCQETIRLFSGMLYQFGGEKLRSALFDELARTAKQHNLPVQIDHQSIHFPEIQEGASFAGYIQPLLQSAWSYVAGVIGEEIVQEELQDLENAFSPTAQHDLDKYQLRAYKASAA